MQPVEGDRYRRIALDAHLEALLTTEGPRRIEVLLTHQPVDRAPDDDGVGHHGIPGEAPAGDLARRDFVISLPRLYRGTHYTHPQVTHARGEVVEASPGGGSPDRGPDLAPDRARGRAIEIEADGELVGALPARFAVLPAALSLLA